MRNGAILDAIDARQLSRILPRLLGTRRDEPRQKGASTSGGTEYSRRSMMVLMSGGMPFALFFHPAMKHDEFYIGLRYVLDDRRWLLATCDVVQPNHQGKRLPGLLLALTFWCVVLAKCALLSSGYSFRDCHDRLTQV